MKTSCTTTGKASRTREIRAKLRSLGGNVSLETFRALFSAYPGIDPAAIEGVHIEGDRVCLTKPRPIKVGVKKDVNHAVTEGVSDTGPIEARSKYKLSGGDNYSILYNLRWISINCHHLVSINRKKLRGAATPPLLSTLDNLSMKRIFSKTKWPVVEYLLYHGAVSALVLSEKLKLTSKTTYRALETMRTLGVIDVLPVGTVKLKKRPAKIWAHIEATKEEIEHAKKLHRMYSSANYRLADNAAQTILEDFDPDETRRSITFEEAREAVTSTCPGHSKAEIVNITTIAAKILHENGVKIWH